MPSRRNGWQKQFPLLLITALNMDPTFSRDAQGGSATGAKREVYGSLQIQKSTMND
jgi:hypothetical protein